jgi:hypothetical protein
MFADWEELADHVAEMNMEFAVQMEKHVRAARAVDDDVPPWQVLLWTACLSEFMVAEMATKKLGGGRNYSDTLADPLLKAMMAHCGRLENEYPGQTGNLGYCQACADFNHHCHNLPLLPMQAGDSSALRIWAKLVLTRRGAQLSRRDVERLIDLAEPLVHQHQRALRNAFYAAPTAT